jgi:DNA-binding CsgD family transcriptional regulator
MNALTSALKDAGVALPPAGKRIWLWLKDHPGKTAKDIATALNIEASTSSSQLTKMEQRGMVAKVYSSVYGDSLRWKTCIPEYDLLPIHKNGIIAKATVTTLPPPIAPKAPSMGALPSYKFDMEKLTIEDARTLYLQLKKLFG